MTNEELQNKLLEGGAQLFSFVIVNDKDILKDNFDIISMNHRFGSFPVWDDISFYKFIKHLNSTKGINYIYNTGDDVFNIKGGLLWSYEDESLIAKRYRKLGKIRYDIFRKRIIDTI